MVDLRIDVVGAAAEYDRLSSPRRTFASIFSPWRRMSLWNAAFSCHARTAARRTSLAECGGTLNRRRESALRLSMEETAS